MRSSFPIPRQYHNFETFHQRMSSPYKSFQNLPETFPPNPYTPPHINNFVNIQNQQNFPPHMQQMPFNQQFPQFSQSHQALQNTFSPNSKANMNHFQPNYPSNMSMPLQNQGSFHHSHSSPQNPKGYAKDFFKERNQFPGRDSLDRGYQRPFPHRTMTNQFSKQSLNPGITRHHSYVDNTSLLSVPQQFYTEDFGNDEFYSNLEEEYLQKVVNNVDNKRVKKKVRRRPVD